jgi:hypothetical protein
MPWRRPPRQNSEAMKKRLQLVSVAVGMLEVWKLAKQIGVRVWRIRRVCGGSQAGMFRSQSALKECEA